MGKFRNFRIAAYIFAQYLAGADDNDIQSKIDFYRHYTGLDKVYIENHRSDTDIPVGRLREVKALFQRNGIEAAGGITATAVVDGQRKPTIFDTLCYTDSRHRERYLCIVRDAASVFDEIILDDFFFTACRCEKCIEAKGSRSWSEFRLDLMEEFSREIVAEAKRVNPDVKFVIKYPNWYESYQETGYDPRRQRDIFDGIYTGTETRDAVYSAQHLQRYESYSIIRLMENSAPGRNGGGWIDPFGLSGDLSGWLEQAELTLLAGAKELTLFNFSILADTAFIPPLGITLERIDHLLDRAGKPSGVAAWEPFDADGEDQLYNYFGMCGIPIEPSPEFDTDAPSVFLAESAACDPSAVEKLEKYVRSGGTAVITTGFLRRCSERGIYDMTSVRPTGRHVLAREYMSDYVSYSAEHFSFGSEPVLFEILSYKTNATWCDVAVVAGENNFPLLTEDNYGKGKLFILNVPENFADLYKLPADVLYAVSRFMTAGQRVFISGTAKLSLFAYDNNTYAVRSFRPMRDTVRITVRGKCAGLRDIERGIIYSREVFCEADGDDEHTFEVPILPGCMFFFETV